ncbi:unnamed protein product [Psylliodes chrysocephalus]|uniref:Uncharacterized protein n=1 Tax=Psylliodes chrysocephalus TaxID=3402493 RepID=A0A9P0CZ71_9CUCU|nr:unnamed protein product [Psylliodes chrysocephala]
MCYHLTKNLTKHLLGIAKESLANKKLLPTTRINHIGKTCRKLITIHAKKDNPSSEDLKTDIQNVVQHVFANHEHCKIDYSLKHGQVSIQNGLNKASTETRLRIFRILERDCLHTLNSKKENGIHCQIPDLPEEEIKKLIDQQVGLLDVSIVEVDGIEQSTRRQSNNPKWFEERQPRLTASTFGDICKRRLYFEKLVKTIIYKKLPSAGIWKDQRRCSKISIYIFNQKYCDFLWIIRLRL